MTLVDAQVAFQGHHQLATVDKCTPLIDIAVSNAQEAKLQAQEILNVFQCNVMAEQRL